MRRMLRASLFLVLGLAPTAPLFGYLADGDLVLRISLHESSGAGQLTLLCQEESTVESALSRHWMLVGPADDARNPSSEHDGWTCTEKIAVESQQAMPFESECGRPQVSMELQSVVRREMENERILQVDLKVERSDGGCGTTNEIASRLESTSRRLYFPDDGYTYLPVWPGQSGDAGPTASQVLVRVSSTRVLPPRLSTFGRIAVVSVQPGAEVHLDGGRVGTVPDNGVMEIGLVLPGLRVVSVREEGQAEQEQVVRVVPGRAHRLEFGDGLKAQLAAAPFQLEALGTNAAGFREFRRPRDGATVIEVPEGEFLMGNHRTERSPHEHHVYLSTFLIDKTGVTWGQYKQFVASTGVPMPPHEPYWGIQNDHPAVYVTWQEARRYCHWAGGRLPTEAEREKAARGTDGRMYPWGEQVPAPELAVFRRTWANEATDPVGLRPLGASPYGAFDMGGNVWEWCSDWYSDEYLVSSPYKDPPGPAMGAKHVVRGGSWDSRPDVTSASCRNWGHPGYREGDFGFRCAMSAPPD